ncbi:MAG TPA: diaminopimelate epimerase [Myxococcaceae bacterium]|nr:diaminopimelate epimerase [Myxococcaceae bacterium]
MSERFHKYHGLGNDFVLLDRREGGGDVGPEQVRALCERRRGVGADGVLVLLPSAGADLRLAIHNADGSVPEMCGNGLRCAVVHVLERAPGRPGSLAVETGAGILSARARWDGERVAEVEVAMGPARLVAPNLPSFSTGSPFVGAPVPGTPFHGTAVSMGNPHLVLLDAPLDQAPLWGPRLERSPGFPERTNVELLGREPPGLRVVVWERGVGLTEACGTGASAALVAAVLAGWAEPERWQEVRLPGGPLSLLVTRDLGQVTLRGPARFVFSAELPAAPAEPREAHLP